VTCNASLYADDGRAEVIARATASWMPVFMPWPPAGLCTWAASPARKIRPVPPVVALDVDTLVSSTVP
jgi:hypothetical protein